MLGDRGRRRQAGRRALTLQEAVEYRRPGAPGSQPGDPRGRKLVKRIVDIRELNEQAKVIDDLK